MMPTTQEIVEIEPELTEGAAGLGWTAASPPGAPIRIAVWNQSKDGAAEDFRRALKRWARILEDER